MSTRPDPTPEGTLLRAALKRSGLSARKAAERAKISYGRWFQIVNGYQALGGGSFHPVRDVPAVTIARMAEVLDVTPEMLEDVGRKDAADELRKLHELSDVDIPEAAAHLLDNIDQMTTEELRDIRKRLGHAIDRREEAG